MRSWYRLASVLSLVALIYGCSSKDDNKDVKVPRSATGTAYLGLAEDANVTVYKVADGFDTPSCTGKTSSDPQVLARTATIDLPFSCFASDDELSLIVVEGGQDVDADNDGVRDASVTIIDGTYHALVRGSDLQGDWNVSPMTEVVYQHVRGALAAAVPANALNRELDRLASQLVPDLVAGATLGEVDYQDVLAWSPREDSVEVDVQTLLDLSDAIRNGETTVTDISQQLSSSFISATATPGTGDFSGQANGKSIAIKDHYAIIADGSRGIISFDISNPGNPVVAGYFDPKDEQEDGLFTTAQDIVINNNIAAVGLGEQGVALLDVSDPTTPTMITHFDGFAGAVSFLAFNRDRYLLVAENTTVHVYDLQNPASPQFLSNFDDWGRALLGMGVYENNVIVMFNCGTCGVTLYQYDITNPASPSFSTMLPGLGSITNTPRHMDVVGDKVFFTSQGQGPSIDVLPPVHALYDLSTNTYKSAPATEFPFGKVANIGNLYFVATDSGITRVAEDSEKLRAYPPQEIFASTSPNKIYDVATYNNRVFAITEYGLEVYNLEEAFDPQIVGSNSLEGEVFAFNVVANESLAIVSARESAQLLDITDPTNPAVLTAFTEQPNIYSFYRDAQFYDNYLFVMRSMPRGGSAIVELLIYDITNPASPVAVPGTQLQDPIYAYYFLNAEDLSKSRDLSGRAMTIYGNYLIAGGEAVIYVFDISDMGNVHPVEIDGDLFGATICNTVPCTESGEAQIYNARLQGDRLYIMKGLVSPYSVQYIDLTLLPSLTRINTGISNIDAMAIDEQLLYTAEGNNIVLYDPTDFSEQGSFNVGGNVQTLLADYPLLYMINDSEARVYDLTQLSAPILIDSIALIKPSEIWLQNGYLFVSEGGHGIKIAALRRQTVP